MEDVRYINGNKKSLLVLILLLACWILIGFIAKQYMDVRLEEIKQIQNTTIAMKELKSVHLWSVVIPGTFFFIINAVISFYIGFLTLKQKQYPPMGISMPFRTRLVKGDKSKQHGYGYIFLAVLLVINAFLSISFWIYIYGI
jgi:hypothetical protein